MPYEPAPPEPLAEVVRRCREETEHFFRRLPHDTGYCHELFRRALSLGESDAFESLLQNYGGLVEGWVRRHSGFVKTGEDAAYFVQAAFEKLWVAIPPDRFGRFPDLPALLRYLQLCVHSSIVDHLRATQSTFSLDGDDEYSPSHEPLADVAPLSDAERAEFWRAIDGKLLNERERVVLHACFGLAMKPAEIPRAFPGTFGTVQEVYRTKQNVLERLRRDSTLRRHLAPYA